ncbi:MAG: recombinase family protein [Candidatus Omnitrophica bacterium]|nr:recombinase family protein [Candidatus Omnitrophota bacterium]
MNETKKPIIRCAIYTRKSTSEGLDQDFTSLDNQREASENYIKSQQHEGWICLENKYDDGGFTGANIDRPALQKLLSDIKDGKINCVVVYKVDRLSRSLLDFSQLLEFFDKNSVAFVSVTQQFNTNTSMGRLTLNILLSFAQFEREIISERTKDKMSAARKKGQWTGGKPPFGYNADKETKKLVINPEEAKVIREIFALYLEGHSMIKIANIINEKGYRTRLYTAKNKNRSGGNIFSLTHIQLFLKSVVYTGKIKYNNQIYAGLQEAIIDEETFKKVQEKIAENSIERKAIKNFDCSGLLTHLLKCKACGTMMYHTYTLKKKHHKYRYYLCTNANKRGYISCPNRSINAQGTEDAVMDCLRKTIQKTKYTAHKTEIDAFLSPVWDTLFFEEKHRIIKILLKEVDYDVSSKKMGLTFKDTNVRLEFDVDVKKSRPVNRYRKEVEITKEPRLRKSLILAHQLQRLMEKGKIKNSDQASEWLGMHQVRLNQTLNLMLLSPSIQTEILDGNSQTISLIPEYKMRFIIDEFDWDKQAQLWRELLQNLPKN